MTGNELFRQACILLNYTDAGGSVDTAGDAPLRRRALPIVNQIYADLWYVGNGQPFEPLTSLTQTLKLDPYVLTNVMPYGVAMLLAGTEGDGDNQAMYSALYNQLRPSARSAGDRVQDALPRVIL